MSSLTNVIISIILVSGLITGMGVFLSDGIGAYGKTDTFESDAFNKISEIDDKTAELQSSISKPTGFDAGTFFDILNFIFFRISVIFLEIPGILISFVTGAESSLSVEGTSIIPDWLTTVIISVIGIFIVMKIVGIVTRREL